MVFLGDAISIPNRYANVNATAEIQKVFATFLKIYNPNDYNYFIKQHPRYKLSEQLAITNQLITPHNSASGYEKKLYANLKPIKFKYFPWEFFISWDYKTAKQTPDYIPFFSAHSNKDDIPQTTLIGLQYTTTVVLSTLTMLMLMYNMSAMEAYKSVDITNFPIPGTFDVIYGGNNGAFGSLDYLKGFRKSQDEINLLHAPYIMLNLMPDITKTQLSTWNFIHLYHLPQIPPNYQTQKTYTKKTLPSVLLPILAFGIISSIYAIYLLYYKKR